MTAEILEKAKLSNTEMFSDMQTLLEVARYSKMIMDPQQVVRAKVFPSSLFTPTGFELF